ncbi:MAG: RhuM family protein [Chitinophagales bacterium]
MTIQEQIVIYQSEDGGMELQVTLQEDTVWLTQAQMADLFETTPQNVTMHLKGVFEEGELIEDATCKDFLQVRKEGKRTVKRNQRNYNLDAIIAIGYRVKSKRATQFRIWANQILKDYLVKGYAINEKRLAQKTEQLSELQQIVALQNDIIKRRELNNTEAIGLLKVIGGYSRALDLLDDYDHQRLEMTRESTQTAYQITYSEARAAIDELGRQTNFEGLFGREKDDSFKGSLQNIFQTFGGIDLYPSIEEKAANLLYFVVKNHSFSDGNKRIAAFLFVWFLDVNHLLFDKNGYKKIADETLVALTLMIAESHSEDKDMMVKVVVNLIQ